MCFTRGLKEAEDRLFVLQEHPANLKEAYQAVLTLRQAQVLGSGPTTRSKPKEQKLQLAQRQREEPLPHTPDPKAGLKGCPGCGSLSTGHTLPHCTKAREAWDIDASLFATKFASASPADEAEPTLEPA